MASAQAYLATPTASAPAPLLSRGPALTRRSRPGKPYTACSWRHTSIRQEPNPQRQEWQFCATQPRPIHHPRSAPSRRSARPDTSYQDELVIIATVSNIQASA